MQIRLLFLVILFSAVTCLQGQMTITSISSTTATCSTNGTVTVTISGGNPLYCYQINGGTCFFSAGTTYTFTDLPPGIKTITVTDGTGSFSASETISVPGNYQPPTLFGTPQGCGVLATATGGLPPYQYSISQNNGPFSPLQSDPFFTPVTGGYCLRVYDACNNFNQYCGFLNISPIDFKAECCENQGLPTEICVEFTDLKGLHAYDPGYWFGGQPPYTYTATAAGLTVTSPDGTFQLPQLCPGWSFSITDFCGNTLAQTPNCIDLEASCINCSAGTATITATNGVPPYLYYYKTPGGSWQPNPSGATTGIFTGILGFSDGDTLSFKVIDACGTESDPLQVNCLDANATFDCALQRANITPLTNYYPVNVTCTDCLPGGNTLLLEGEIADFGIAVLGQHTFIITDNCGGVETIICRDTLPDVETTLSCNTVVAQMRSNYVCNDEAPQPLDIQSGVAYSITTLAQPGNILSSNGSGIFPNLTPGETYIITANHGTCGTAKDTVTLFDNGQYSIDTKFQVTSFILNGICRTGYNLTAAIQPEPDLPPVYSLNGTAGIYTNDTGEFSDLLPGNWSLSVDNYCASIDIILPEWKPELSVAMPECPNGSCVQMSGDKNYYEWQDWGIANGINIESNADFFLINCPGFDGPQCGINWGGNICNLIPGDSYTVYILPGTFTCPVDTISFVVDPIGSAKIDSVFASTPVACAVNSFGNLALTVVGGKYPLRLEVIDSLTGQVLKVLQDDDNNGLFEVDSLEALKTYFFRVVDGCNNTLDVSATVVLLPGVTADYSYACDGTITLHTVPILNAIYTWKDATGTVLSSATGLWDFTTAAPQIATSYTVDISFGNCPPHTTGVTVPGLLPPSVLTNINDTLFCQAIDVDILAITGPGAYTYSWSTGASSPLINALLPGTYEITATDIHGCRDSAAVTLDYSAAISLSLQPTNAACNGDSTGQILSSVLGGTPGFNYFWENGNTTSSLNQIPAGTYSLTLTDTKGCTQTATTSVTEPNPLQTSFTTTPTLCDGSSDGNAQVLPTGGTPGYVIHWSTTSTSPSISALEAGIYTVTITDSNNCSKVDSVSIESPPLLTLQLFSENVLCYGGATGSISTDIGGGSPQYTLLWNTGSNSDILTGLQAGSYTVTLTDQNGCSAIDTASISEPPLLQLSLQLQDVQCFNSADGNITTIVTGGTPGDIIYNWSNGSSFANIQNIPAGIYTVTIGDQNACTTTASATVSEPAELQVLLSAAAVSCFGGMDGTAAASVSGGTPPYLYSWSVAGNSTPEIDSLVAGNYTVTVTDTHNCTATASISIISPAPVSVTLLPQMVSCNGYNDGAATASTIGGTAPYSYEWENGGLDNPRLQLAANVYTVTVTDQNGCTSSATTSVTEPPLLEIEKTEVIPNNCNGAPGAISITPTGGTAPYSANWSNGATGFNISGLQSGLYTVTITDSAGCTFGLTIEMEGILPYITTETVTNVSCFGYTDGSFTFETIEGGEGPPYWLNGSTIIEEGFTISDLAPGNYTYILSDSTGCSTLITANIQEPPPFNIYLPETVQIELGETAYLEPLVLGSPALPLSWLWTPPEYLSCTSCPNTQATPYQSKWYELQAVDANGCIASDNVQVIVNLNCDIYVPNIFTPKRGGDGNDILVIFAGNCVKEIVEWSIFDRWGGQVFYQSAFPANSYDNGWIGKWRNKYVENGVYVWQARVRLIDDRVIFLEGNVTVAN